MVSLLFSAREHSAVHVREPKHLKKLVVPRRGAASLRREEKLAEGSVKSILVKGIFDM